MTRRTCELEIVKADEKSPIALVDVIQSLAVHSKLNWEATDDSYGFYAISSGELCFEFAHSRDIYNKTTAQFGVEEVVWDNYMEDIRTVAEKFPQFEFYYHVVSDGVSFSDEIIYACGSSYSSREYTNPSPKRMWNITAREALST